MNEILVIGPTLLTQTVYVDQLVDEKKEYPAEITSINCGGTFELAINLSDLDVITNYVTKFSNDEDAANIWSKLNNKNIMTYSVGHLMETPKQFIVLDNNNDALTFSHSKLDIYPNDILSIPSIVVNRCTYGVCELINSTFASDLFSLYPQVKWILDRNILSDEVISKVEGVTLSYKDATKIVKEKDFGLLANRLLIQGCKWVVITKNNDGIYFFNNKLQKYYSLNTSSKKAYLGDHQLYVALLLTCLVRDYSIEEAVLIANEQFEKIILSE